MSAPQSTRNSNLNASRKTLPSQQSVSKTSEGQAQPLRTLRLVSETPQPTRARWRSLLTFTTKAHILPFSLALVLSVASGIIIPALALFLGTIFDAFTAFGAGTIDGNLLMTKVSTNAIFLVALGGAGWVLNGTYFAFWVVFGELQAKAAREKLYQGMLEREMSWYDTRKTGIHAMVPRTQT